MKNEYSFKDGGLVYVFAVAGLFLASVVFSMILGIVSTTTGQELGSISHQNWVSYLNALLSELAFFLAFIIYSKQNKIKKYSLKNINKSTFDLRLLIVFALSLVVFFGSLNFTTFFDTLFLNFASPASSNIPMGNFGEFLLSILCFAIFPAIAEELVFRGVIFSSLKNKIGACWAVVVSALVFTLIHFSIFQTIHQFLLGVVLALVFYFTGKLVYSMFFHFFNNFFVLFFVYITGNENFAIFSNFGATEIVLTFVIFLACAGLAVLLFYLLKLLTKREHAKVLASETVATDSDRKTKKEDALETTFRYADAVYIALYSLAIIVCVIVWAVNSFLK